MLNTFYVQKFSRKLSRSLLWFTLYVLYLLFYVYMCVPVLKYMHDSVHMNAGFREGQ